MSKEFWPMDDFSEESSLSISIKIPVSKTPMSTNFWSVDYLEMEVARLYKWKCPSVKYCDYGFLDDRRFSLVSSISTDCCLHRHSNRLQWLLTCEKLNNQYRINCNSLMWETNEHHVLSLHSQIHKYMSRPTLGLKKPF